MITINGRILENRFTTSQWGASTVVLPDRVWGHEVDGSGVPVGSKMGDGINIWNDLPYWYVGSSATTIIEPIPTGTNFDYPYSGVYGEYPNVMVQQVAPDTGVKARPSVPMYDLLDNGNILVYGDFNDGDWELVVKP